MNKKKDKNTIFDKIATLKTTLELEKQGLNNKVDLLGNLESAKLKNKNDSFSFVIDILVLLVGPDVIRKSVTKIFTQFKSIEKDFKESLKKEITSNIDDSTPIPPKVLLGIKTPIKNIDTLSLLNLDIVSDEGKLLLGDTNSIMYKLYHIVRDDVVGFKDLNTFLKVSYDKTTGYISVIPKTPNLKFKVFIHNYIDSIKLIEEKELIKIVLGSLFSLRKKKGKSKETLIMEEKLDSLIEKISKNEDPETYFKFNIDNLLSEEFKSNGEDRLITEIGCGRTATTITANEINEIFQNETRQFSEEVIDDTLNNVGNTLIKNNETKVVNPSDKQSIKNNFFKELIKKLKISIIKSLIFNPEVQLLLLMIDVSKNKDISKPINPVEQISKKKKTIACIIKSIMSAIIKILYQLLRKEILSLISGVISIYAKESIDKYKKILKSIVKSK